MGHVQYLVKSVCNCYLFLFKQVLKSMVSARALMMRVQWDHWKKRMEFVLPDQQLVHTL